MRRFRRLSRLLPLLCALSMPAGAAQAVPPATAEEAALMAPPPPPPPPSPVAIDPFKIQRKVKPRYAPAPTYPDYAACQGLSGRVELILAIDHEGSVTYAEVENSSGERVLDDAARESVARWWKFDPEIVNSEPVSVLARVPVDFVRPKSPPRRCAPSLELRQIGGDRAADQFAANEAIEVVLAHYAFVPTDIAVNYKRAAARGQPEISVHEAKRNVAASRERQFQHFALPVGSAAGKYWVEVAIDGAQVARTPLQIR